MLLDFYENGEMDPLLILNHTAMDSYYSFLKKADKDYDEYLSEEEISSLKFISKNLASGKRPHELLILKSLIYNGYFSVESIEHLLKAEYDIQNDVKSIESAIDVLNLDYSPIKGPEGNIEYLIHLRKSDAPKSYTEITPEELVKNSHSQLDK